MLDFDSVDFVDLEIATCGAENRCTYVGSRRAFHHIADRVFDLGAAVFHVDQQGRPIGLVRLGKLRHNRYGKTSDRPAERVYMVAQPSAVTSSARI